MNENKVNPNLLKGNLELILLSILENQDMYGLEIVKEANSRTNGYFDFKEGSLYPALHRLTQAGFLSAEFRPAPRGNAQVRYYHISKSGKTELAEKRKEFKTFNAAVEAISKKTILQNLWGQI